ncbi:hypothetical protein FHL15_001471 [Xylaria flabelliformis]|uniref:Uncharacterized protein n=1 Tax=Xylaria flabelliformis TaxID=2512241 RepID=A0A553IC01_9PEZI|nr:hypothetical protein FHL15_001471 [Xylaria flabelliformis]
MWLDSPWFCPWAEKSGNQILVNVPQEDGKLSGLAEDKEMSDSLELGTQLWAGLHNLNKRLSWADIVD